MGAKRGERVAPPPGPDEWDVRFATTEAAKGWEALSQAAPGNTRKAWDLMSGSPGRGQHDRHHRLKYELKNRVYRGRELPQWQIEVTGGGRIWYLLDTESRTVWVSYAGTGHPKATD